MTVLFADVVESTGLAERLDAEDVRRLLARYYATAREVVEDRGGTLEKFIGDAVVAVFGLPRAHGDDASRALSAALELRDRVRADGAIAGYLAIRVGVNTGEVIANPDSSGGDFLMTGDAVNVAARLQQAGEPWAILSGERTAHAGGSEFTFGPQISVEAKGRTLPVRAFPLLGRTARAHRPRTPLVGREAELAQLELVARRAFAERRPFLVSVVAPPGTGKTRLLEEFLERLPATGTGTRVAVAQCLPYGQQLTYWPLRGVLFRLVGIGDGARPEEVPPAIRSWLEASGVEDPDRTAGLLAATVGAGDADATDPIALFSAWRRMLEAASRDAPLVLVFEDLHWSSDSLLELVEFVMQPRGRSRVLTLALTRPELLDRRPGWGGGLRDYVSLTLEPLSDDAVAELVGHLVEAPSPELAAEVVSRAEGNPFYAGEIVRSVVERVPSLDDREALERALSTLPDTVQATVLARLDLLPSAERRLVQLASVFGGAFRTAGVAALAPDLTDIERMADDLAGRELIVPAAGERYEFRHVLIREVAYQTLPRAARARLHTAAGRWLEEQGAGRGEILAELVAYHYREAAVLASRTDPDSPETRDVRRTATEWLARAADVAARAAASVEAVSHLRGAIELAEAAALPELYERLGDVELVGETGVEAHREALRLRRQLGGSADAELRVLGKLFTTYTRIQGSVASRPSREEIARLLAEGDDLLSKARDKEAIAVFLVARAFLPFWDTAYTTPRDLAAASESARRGLAIAEELDDANLRSTALDALSAAALSGGLWDDARRYARLRLELGERLDLLERLDAHAMVTWAGALLGDLEDAERVSAGGLALVRPGQGPAWTLHLLAWRIYTLFLLGRWDEVTTAGDRARELWEESGRGPGSYAVRGFVCALDVARARRDRRRVDAHTRLLDEVLAQYPDDAPLRQVSAYVGADLDALAGQVIETFGQPTPDLQELLDRARTRLERVEHWERIVALLADRRRLPPEHALVPITRIAEAQRLMMVEAQARRALGLLRGDASLLGVALERFDRAGSVPYAARVRCELALLSGDRDAFRAGLGTLRSLGDVEQFERYEEAARERGLAS